MKLYKILTILILSLSFAFSQTYRTTSDGFGNTTTRSSDGTTYRTTSDGFGNTTTRSSNWWD